MGVHLGVCEFTPSQSPVFSGVYVTFVLHSQSAPLHALALVMSPRLKSWHEWLLLLQKIDFKVVYKLGRVHFLLDHLSRISHGELVERVDDKLFNVHLFNVRVDWYGPIIKYLKKGYFDSNVPKEENSQIVIKAKSYTLYDGQLYKLKLDGVI